MNKLNAHADLEDSKISLFDLHLDLIDHPNNQANSEWESVKRRRHHPRKELTFKRYRSYRSIGMVVFALAASLTVIVYHGAQNDVAIKGQAKVFVVYEAKDHTGIWDGQTPLTSGTRVNAEILSPQDSVAFVAIFDRQDNLLSSEDSVAGSRLLLKAGVRGHFQNAFELTNENDGEKLFVVVCDQQRFEFNEAKNMQKLTEALKSDSVEGAIKNSLSICGLKSFTLRK